MFDGWSAHYANKPTVSSEVDFYVITFDLKAKAEGGGGQKSGQKIDLTKRQLQIIDIIAKNPHITREELSL